MRYIILTILFVSCVARTQEIQVDTFDSTEVRPLHDSVAKILPAVERVIVKRQREIVYKIKDAENLIEQLKVENAELKELTKVTKTIIQRDTIYIKEKTNFWGKKRISADSSSSVDSTIIEQ